MDDAVGVPTTCGGAHIATWSCACGTPVGRAARAIVQGVVRHRRVSGRRMWVVANRLSCNVAGVGGHGSLQVVYGATWTVSSPGSVDGARERGRRRRVLTNRLSSNLERRRVTPSVAVLFRVSMRTCKIRVLSCEPSRSQLPVQQASCVARYCKAFLHVFVTVCRNHLVRSFFMLGSAQH